jgi:hypothetical protein
MRAWPRNPVVYEVNTWVWLGELSRKHQRPVDLGTVPAQEWDAIASLGFDAVWFMGVWERGRDAGRRPVRGSGAVAMPPVPGGCTVRTLLE